MADGNDLQRLNELEQRLNALESQAGYGGGGQGGYGGGTGYGGGQGGGVDTADPMLVQQYLQGALIANALVNSELQTQQGGGQRGAAPQFLSLFSCGGGGGAPTPTNYDSVFWCRSRFLCNPSSLSCLC